MPTEKGIYQRECEAYAAISQADQEAEERRIEHDSAADFHHEYWASARAEVAMEEENDARFAEYQEEEFWTFPNEQGEA